MEAFFSQVIHAYQSHIVELSEFGSRAEGMWKREKPIKQTATAGTQTNGILFLNKFELKNKDLTKGGLFSRNTKLKLCQKTPFLQNYGISVKCFQFIAHAFSSLEREIPS